MLICSIERILLENHSTTAAFRRISSEESLPHKLKTEEEKDNHSSDLCFDNASPFLKNTGKDDFGIYPLSIDTNLAEKFSVLSLKNKRKSPPQNGYCLRSVKYTLYQALKKSNFPVPKIFDLNKLPVDPGRSPHKYTPGLSAEKFRKWISENPISACKNLRLADITKNESFELKPGYILLYGKGSCGFHKHHGHIEVVSSVSPEIIVCSDHCRKIDKVCQSATILAPVKHCSFM